MTVIYIYIDYSLGENLAKLHLIARDKQVNLHSRGQRESGDRYFIKGKGFVSLRWQRLSILRGSRGKGKCIISF